MNKKAIELGLNLVAISAIAVIILLVYSFMTKGFVFRFLEGIGVVHGENEDRANCIAEAGSPDDQDGDGYIDGTITVDGREIDCSKFSII